MTNDGEPVLCVDVGNTNIRFGIVEEEVSQPETMLTKEMIANPNDFLAALPKGVRASAYCSVTPAADSIVQKALQSVAAKPFRLTSETCGKLPVRYPNPEQVGQDRLANALAAHILYGAPAIVIDVGTAATFDIVTKEYGYEGGVIVPGPQVLLECLQDRTALLPHVSLPKTQPREAIGRSTSEAMLIGMTLGFSAMVLGILEEVKISLTRLEKDNPLIITTGGGAFRISEIEAIDDPNLTLKGLALAFWANNKE